ncbi:uncharacterized protein LOC117319229 [Pecten maximus]|uniref:uncharacterized protein LOC117319229 n=1 Tax=Pecten maximus TaxID=6579 RepID=UPI001458FA05|nr:uncharacterized protein LOC117319229 [Pecten maximus]
MNNQGIQEPPNAQRNQEQQEAASSSAATSSASTSSAATSSASTFEIEEEESWGIEEYIEDEPSKAKKRKCNETRKAWTSEEEQELLQLFQVNFSSKKNPGMKECNSAISRSRKQHGFIHKRNWETIKKKVMRMFKSSK